MLDERGLDAIADRMDALREEGEPADELRADIGKGDVNGDEEELHAPHDNILVADPKSRMRCSSSGERWKASGDQAHGLRSWRLSR